MLRAVAHPLSSSSTSSRFRLLQGRGVVANFHHHQQHQKTSSAFHVTNRTFFSFGGSNGGKNGKDDDDDKNKNDKNGDKDKESNDKSNNGGATSNNSTTTNSSSSQSPSQSSLSAVVPSKLKYGDEAPRFPHTLALPLTSRPLFPGVFTSVTVSDPVSTKNEDNLVGG